MNKDLKENWKKTFAIIWAGQAASLLTSAIIQSAIVWHIAAETGSATVLSIAAMFGYIPMAVFGPFIGSLIDRWPRKRIMIAADLFIALTSAFLAVLAFDGELGIFAICSALLARAIGTAFHSPCLQAVTPMIVPKDQLARCGGYSYTLQSVALVASPAIAAALYPILPFWMLMLLDVVGAACGILTIAVCRIPELEPSEPRPLRLVFSEAYEGLQSMRQIKGLLALTVIGSLFSLAYIPVASLYPLMSMSYFGGTTTHAGIVEAAFSGGMVLGGLTLGIWGGTKNKM
ncbi:MAG: MFS transporter, partial [Clostridiales bacterium]|nr:MFS transporter [Clostridiales bacterium]